MDQLQQIASQLGIDQSFYSVFIAIVGLYFILSLVYLKPYQRLLDSRRFSTEGVRKEAQDLMAQAELKHREYTEKLRSVNEKARGLLQAAEDSARKEESIILNAAAEKAKDSLQKVQSQLDSEKKAIVTAIASEVSALATDVATKVLGRPVGAPSNGNGR